MRDWRGGNVDLWIDEDGDFGIMKAEARRSLVINGSDIQKIAAWLGGTSLTDAEREAVEQAERCLLWQSAVEAESESRDGRPPQKSVERAQVAATLRGLRERLK